MQNLIIDSFAVTGEMIPVKAFEDNLSLVFTQIEIVIWSRTHDCLHVIIKNIVVMTGSESCREEKRTELFIIEKIRIFQNQLVIDLILTYGIAYFKIYCCISSGENESYSRKNCR